MGCQSLERGRSPPDTAWVVASKRCSSRAGFEAYPVQCYRRDGEITADLGNAFVVAHNAGDSLTTTRAALEHGADVIEIDVISRGGRLLAGHPRRAGLLSRFALPVLPFEVAWEAASAASAIKLDLKETWPGFIRLVVAFLEAHPVPRTIIVTRDAGVIQGFAELAPAVIRVLSTPRDSLARFRRDTRLAELIDGISGHPTIFDADFMAWIRERGLLSLSSVVDSFPLADRLLHAGLNGIITDNLALMEAIGGGPGIAVTDRGRPPVAS